MKFDKSCEKRFVFFSYTYGLCNCEQLNTQTKTCGEFYTSQPVLSFAFPEEKIPVSFVEMRTWLFQVTASLPVSFPSFPISISNFCLPQIGNGFLFRPSRIRNLEHIVRSSLWFQALQSGIGVESSHEKVFSFPSCLKRW